MKFRNKILFIILLPLISCNGLLHKKTSVSVVFELEIASPDKDILVCANVRNVLMRRLETFGFNTSDIDIELHGFENLLKLVINNFDSTKTQLTFVRKLLTTSGNLEFWKTYENEKLIYELAKADSCLLASEELGTTESKKSKIEDTTSLINLLAPKFSAATVTHAEREHPLFFILQPFVDRNGIPVPGPIVGRALIKDTSRVMYYLNNEKVKFVLPRDVKFAWTSKSEKGAESVMQLVALKATGSNKQAALYGDIIADAWKEYNPQDKEIHPHIMFNMNREAQQIWEALMADNIGKSIAIVLDNYVYSCPTVKGKFSSGQSQITGDFTSREADELISILKYGKTPVKIMIKAENFYSVQQ